MKLVRTFVASLDGSDCGLLSVYYGNKRRSAYDEALQNFTNAQWLKDFLEQKSELLNSEYHQERGHTINKILVKVNNEIRKFQKDLNEAKSKGARSLCQFLESSFKALNDHERHDKPHLAVKLKPEDGCVIRIYGVRVTKTLFIMTGAGIKLVKYMDEDEALIEERLKMEKLRTFLQSEGLFDPDQFEDFIIEL